MLYLGSLGTRQSDIDKLIRRLHSKSAQLVFVYEAGPCGYWLYPYLTKKRLLCWVVAPSLIPKKPGDKVETNRRDAAYPPHALGGSHPALRPPGSTPSGISPVVGRTPSAISKPPSTGQGFLLRQDIRYEGKATG